MSPAVQDALTVLGVTLSVSAVVLLLVMAAFGKTKGATRPEMPSQLKSADEHKRRVEDNRLIAMGRVAEQHPPLRIVSRNPLTTENRRDKASERRSA